MSVRSEKPTVTAEPGQELANAAAATDQPLGEGNSFAVASPENPLRRHVVVSIRASLNELCLQKQRGTWAPSQEALRSIFQQRKFTSLDGAAEPMGGESCPQAAASNANPTRHGRPTPPRSAPRPSQVADGPPVCVSVGRCPHHRCR